MVRETTYSICATTYNTVETVERAIEPLLLLPQEYEVVIVDSKSTDGTYERLKEYEPRIRVISERCTRGRGRDIAIRNANGRYVIMIDFDVVYYDIGGVLARYLDLLNSKLILVNPKTRSCNAPIVLGSRDIFLRIGSYPNINVAEDAYLHRVASSLGILIDEIYDFKHACIKVRGGTSGKESRYESNVIGKFCRAAFATRDSLFVKHLSFSEFTRVRKLSGIQKLIIGLPMYIIGITLRPTIRIERVEDRVHRLLKSGPWENNLAS